MKLIYKDDYIEKLLKIYKILAKIKKLCNPLIVWIFYGALKENWINF